jgi:hypothetical protein
MIVLERYRHTKSLTVEKDIKAPIGNKILKLKLKYFIDF